MSALDVRAKEINEEMKLAAVYAIAGLISDDELHANYVIPILLILESPHIYQLWLTQQWKQKSFERFLSQGGNEKWSN